MSGPLLFPFRWLRDVLAERLCAARIHEGAHDWVIANDEGAAYCDCCGIPGEVVNP